MRRKRPFRDGLGLDLGFWEVEPVDFASDDRFDSILRRAYPSIKDS